MIVFRHADTRYPFLWETAAQPAARWHGPGEGPVHYFADTPDGAWAEFLRHEGITAASDLANVKRAMWAVEVPEEPETVPQVADAVMIGGLRTYRACQAEASRLRAGGVRRLNVPSAALLASGATGQVVRAGLVDATARDGRVLVLFGARPDLVGWRAAAEGRPADRLLARVRHL
jgi:hypothetical protein